METTTAKEITYISKLSVKTLGCNPKVAAAQKQGQEKPLPLAHIYGMASGTFAYDVNGTVGVGLTGEFEGTNLEDGSIYRSGKLFLPKGIQEVIESAVKKLGDGESVSFALEIRAVKASNPIGYSYEARNLMATQSVDPLSEMRKALPAHKDVDSRKEKK